MECSHILNTISHIHVRNKMAIGKNSGIGAAFQSVTDALTVLKNSLQLFLLDEEACRSRNFQPCRVGWTYSSLNQNQAVACTQK